MTEQKNPTVILAGKEYPVPLLVPKQQREVIPRILKFTNVLLDLSKMTSEDYNDMLRIVYYGAMVPNADMFPNNMPHFDRDLADQPVQWNEIVAAVGVIRERTGVFKKESFDMTLDELSAGLAEMRQERGTPKDAVMNSVELSDAISFVATRKRKEMAATVGEAKAGA